MIKERELSEAELALAKTSIESLVQPAESKFKFLDERFLFEDNPVFIQILCMDKNYFVWVGSIPPVMNLLQYTLPSASVR